MEKMIMITGASGNFGKETIDALIKKGVNPEKINGLVRDRAKGKVLEEKTIGIRKGDYNDYDSLVTAFQGVEKLLLVSGNDLMNRALQHANVVKAGREAGVKHLVYTSFERKNESESSPIHMVASAHLNTERVIRQSGIPYTIMRNNLYMDGLPMFLGEKVLETGIFFPAGDTRAAYVLRREMAEAAACILTGSGHEDREYYISNSVPVSFVEIASLLEEITGRKVSYTSPDLKTYQETLSGLGVPEEAIGFFSSFAEGVRQGEFLPPGTDLEDLLGRKPTSVREFLTRLYGSEK